MGGSLDRGTTQRKADSGCHIILWWGEERKGRKDRGGRETSERMGIERNREKEKVKGGEKMRRKEKSIEREKGEMLGRGKVRKKRKWKRRSGGD